MWGCMALGFDTHGSAMAQRTRVLLLIPRLGAGGAEQVMTLLARGLSSEKYEVHLGLVMAGEAPPAGLPPRITLHPLCAGRARYAATKLLRLVWSLKPDVIISGAAEISFVALLLRPLFPRKTCLIVRQNGTASAALEFGHLPGYTRFLYRTLFRRADRLICQSSAMAQDLAHLLGIEIGQIAVLPNPVDFDGIAESSHTCAARIGTGPHLLAVGRLSREKGIDLLLDAMPGVLEHFPGADLMIAGAGTEEAALKAQCHALRLEESVSFAGHLENVYAFFPGTTLFVLPSRYEGMPNALLEAAAAGLPS